MSNPIPGEPSQLSLATNHSVLQYQNILKPSLGEDLHKI